MHKASAFDFAGRSRSVGAGVPERQAALHVENAAFAFSRRPAVDVKAVEVEDRGPAGGEFKHTGCFCAGQKLDVRRTAGKTVGVGHGIRHGASAGGTGVVGAPAGFGDIDDRVAVVGGCRRAVRRPGEIIGAGPRSHPAVERGEKLRAVGKRLDAAAVFRRARRQRAGAVRKGTAAGDLCGLTRADELVRRGAQPEAVGHGDRIAAFTAADAARRSACAACGHSAGAVAVGERGAVECVARYSAGVICT